MGIGVDYMRVPSTSGWQMLKPSTTRSILVREVSPSSLETYFASLSVAVANVPHAKARGIFEAAKMANIPNEQMVRVVPLHDKDGVVLCILPASQILDLKLVHETLSRDLTPMEDADIAVSFKGVDPRCMPPIPSLYQAETMVDISLFEAETLYFQMNDSESLTQITTADYQKLVQDSWQGRFSVSSEFLMQNATKNQISLETALQQFVPKRFKSRVEETFELPALPPMAEKILLLRADPNADAIALAKLVEKDPSLAAQVVSWARSPYYGYVGQIDSVEDAIIKVLGFDLVMNLALGIACGRGLNVEKTGPLGLKDYWRFSLYTAALCEALSRIVPSTPRPKRGLAYLSGLLHNFGFLLLGHLFSPQFKLVNQYAQLNPHCSTYLLEQYTLHISHQQFGSWLFKAWHLPKEVIMAAEYHHQEVPATEGAEYALLVQLAIRLLKREWMGDSAESTLPVSLMDRLGIAPEEAEEVLFTVMTQKESLDLLADELFAS